MAETEQDLRGYRLLLVSHGVLAGPGASASMAGSVVDWADRNQVGLYQLPVPAHALRPRTAAGRLTRPRVADQRQEVAELEVVFAQIVDYLAAGYGVVGLAVADEEVSSGFGRAWLSRVLEVAQTTSGLTLEVWRIPKGAATFEPGLQPNGLPTL